ncbi:MAG: hypothetical protein R3234_13980 [Thermoanaerobaculia bacterium]|nr:hypothetical protein [Thermoanaerobaculia bacterium]
MGETIDTATWVIVAIVVLLTFLGGGALLRWYDRSYLGNPPSRWDWIWPGLFALTVLVFAVFRPGVGAIALAGIVGIVSIAQYRAYRHGSLGDEEDSGMDSPGSKEG